MWVRCRNDEKKPRRVAALRGIEIQQISTGGWHCLALDSAGLVYAWGGNEYGQCHVEWAVRCACLPFYHSRTNRHNTALICSVLPVR